MKCSVERSRLRMVYMPNGSFSAYKLGMYVYFIVACSDPPLTKIGSSNNPQLRLGHLQVGSPVPLELIHTWRCKSASDALQSEKWLHHLFAKHRRHGEWLMLTEKELGMVMRTAPNLALLAAQKVGHA